MRQIVLKETDGGRRIVRSVVSILEGNAPNCTPWHQIEAAKLLYKLGLGEAPSKRPPLPHQPVIPAEAGIQGRVDVPGEGTQNIPSPSMVEGQPRHSCESRNPQGEEQGDPSCASCSSMSDELIKLNKKLVRQIRVDTYEGASMVRYLIDIMEGDDPSTRGRDRIDAIKILLRLCYDNPAQPDPEFMMFYAPCHPDCLCVCKDLPEDHPKVVEAHTPPTDEQREQWAKEQAQQEEWDRRTDELIERKIRAEKQWKQEQFHSPAAADERRIEREEKRKRRQLKREQEKEEQQKPQGANIPRVQIRHLAMPPTTTGPRPRARPQPLTFCDLCAFCGYPVPDTYLNCNSRFGFSRSSQSASTATDSF